MPSMLQALLVPCLALLASHQDSTDWPQFLGPESNGSAPLEGVDFDWPDEGPAVNWAFPAGAGYGGVAVRDGEVFFLDRKRGVADVLRVLDLDSGDEKWSVSYDAPGRLSFAGSRTVPTVTEKYVYSSGGQGHIACYDRSKQEMAWMVNMEESFDGIMPMYGWCGAPLVIGDLVIGTPLGNEVGLVGLDRFTGDEVWVTEGVGRSHSTPHLLELFGEQQIVFVSTVATGGFGRNDASEVVITSFNPEDGTTIWQTEATGSRLPIPGILKVDEERIFLTGGYRGGSTMLHIEKKDDEYAFEQLFYIERGSQIHQPILHGDHIYVIVNENWNNDRGRQKEGGLLCLDLTGEEVWRTGNAPFFGRGNVLLAGDHLLIQDGFNGTLRVAKATPDGYQQIAEANIFDISDRRDHQMWAPMALSGRLLLLRSQDELLCVEL